MLVLPTDVVKVPQVFLKKAVAFGKTVDEQGIGVAELGNILVQQRIIVGTQIAAAQRGLAFGVGLQGLHLVQNTVRVDHDLIVVQRQHIAPPGGLHAQQFSVHRLGSGIVDDPAAVTFNQGIGAVGAAAIHSQQVQLVLGVTLLFNTFQRAGQNLFRVECGNQDRYNRQGFGCSVHRGFFLCRFSSS